MYSARTSYVRQQLCRNLTHRDRMKICDAVVAVELVRERTEVRERAEVVAYSAIAARLNAREGDFFACCFVGHNIIDSFLSL